jgi:hypothetical protein
MKKWLTRMLYSGSVKRPTINQSLQNLPFDFYGVKKHREIYYKSLLLLPSTAVETHDFKMVRRWLNSIGGVEMNHNKEREPTQGPQDTLKSTTACIIISLLEVRSTRLAPWLISSVKGNSNSTSARSISLVYRSRILKISITFEIDSVK